MKDFDTLAKFYHITDYEKECITILISLNALYGVTKFV